MCPSLFRVRASVTNGDPIESMIRIKRCKEEEEKDVNIKVHFGVQ